MVVKNRWARKMPVDLRTPRETTASDVTVYKLCDPCEACEFTGRVFSHTEPPYDRRRWEQVVHRDRRRQQERFAKARRNAQKVLRDRRRRGGAR